MKKILLAIMIVLLLASSGLADTLQDYITNYSTEATALNIGGVHFYGFAYTPSSSGGDALMPASGITVTPMTDPLNPGLRFNAGWSAGVGQTMDSYITFLVKATGSPITDMSATMSGVGFLSTGIASVAMNGTPGNIYLVSSTGLAQDSEEIFFDAISGLISVSKDISVNGGTSGAASISSVTDNFSVPEPATLLLLGFGLIGLAVARRKIKK